MKKACLALITLLIALCLYFAPQTALAATCSASVGQSASPVAPGATVTVSISMSIESGTVSEIFFQPDEIPGLSFVSASVQSGWYFAVNSPSYMNVRGGSATAGSSVSITLTYSFDPNAHGTYVYNIYSVQFIDEYGEPMGTGGGSATFEVHTKGTEWVIGQSPTCAEEGKLVIKCNDCPYIYEQKPISMIAHVPGTPMITTMPTCLLDGEETTYCVNCSTVLETKAVSATGHTPGEWQTVTTPTCTVNGLNEKRCSICNVLLDSQAIAATGHTSGDWQTVTAPTCMVSGLNEKRCTTCNVLLDSQAIAATGHTPGVWQTATAPTCTESGLNEQRCTTCSALLDSQIVAAAGHTLGGWQTVTAPTCTQKGKQEKHCTVCSALLDTNTLAAKGHTPGEWLVTLRQTTDTPGMESQLCDVCGKTLDTRELPATSEPRTDSLATLPGETMADEAPLLSEKWPTYTSIDLSKPQILEFPIVTEGGYVVGTVTVTIDGNGMVTITYVLTAKGASIKAGAMAFLPTDRDWKVLTPEELTETPIDPAAAFSYTAPLDTIPQKDGFAMLCLNFVVDYDVYAEGVKEYLPEAE
jgi:hypothetical protein